MRAVELVRDRLLRATATMENAGIAYAVIRGNAVAAWVGQVDQSAVRFTQDVDLLILRSDLDATKAALQAAGFIYRHVASDDLFLDGPDAKARDAIHVIFAGEKVRADYALPAPDVMESEPAESFRVLRLDALVRMKLTSFRDKDRTHLRDLISVGLIDESWLIKLPDEMAARLKSLLDTPDGWPGARRSSYQHSLPEREGTSGRDQVSGPASAVCGVIDVFVVGPGGP
jgi:hypothetical protein